MMFAAFFLFLLLPLVSAQIVQWGPCPTPHVQSNFKLERYLGRWYEIEKIPTYFGRGKCIEANYSLRKGGTIKVVNSQIFRGQFRSGEGTAVARNKREPAKLGVRFSSFSPYSPYWVVRTDYTSFAIVYSCMDILHLFHFQYAWILGRSRSLPRRTINFSKNLLKREGIRASKMRATDQSCNDDDEPHNDDESDPSPDES